MRTRNAHSLARGRSWSGPDSFRPAGMTVLELMIVLAIIGAMMVLARTGFRMLTKADLVENSTELSAVMHRASGLAIEKGELIRVTFDMDKQIYAVEQCQGTLAIERNEAIRPDDEKTKRAKDKGTERLRGVPMQALAPDPEAATKNALAIAGHHIADRVCMPVEDGESGDAEG